MYHYTLRFYQRIKQSSKDIPVYCRLTFLGSRLDLAVGAKVNPSLFDSNSQSAKGKSQAAIQTNRRIDQLKSEINKVVSKYEIENKPLSISQIKEELSGKKSKAHLLLRVFHRHNKSISKLIGNGYSDATFEKYQLTKFHLANFISKNFDDLDIPVIDLNYGFISEFENYLLSDLKNAVSSVNKHTQRLKKVINYSILHDIVEKDPFIKHKPIKEITKKIVFLDDDELKALENKEFPIERLSRIRDFFVFCCYTGLAFSDVHSLTKENLVKDSEGDQQIVYTREKTGKTIYIPLLNQARDILKKYASEMQYQSSDKLLPIPSNVKFNAYLKEIADLCGINKNLTVHTARKTFATTVLLFNDVPMETASELLGHYSVKMTQQLYGKIVNKKVQRDIKKLRTKLISNTKTE